MKGAHEDLTRRPHVRPGSDRAFGLVMSAALTLVALAPLRHGAPPRWWSLVAAAVFAALALLWSRPLRPLNVAWTRLGLLLNRVTSPVLLAAVFYAAVVPTGLLMQAFGRDPMRRRRDPRAQSYWILRDQPPGSMTRQF